MSTKQNKKAAAPKSGAKKPQQSAYEIDVALAKSLGIKVIRTGSHLTVTTFPDGHQELKWDDEALAREVREAIASVEGKQ